MSRFATACILPQMPTTGVVVTLVNWGLYGGGL